jgi:hypothetical protein
MQHAWPHRPSVKALCEAMTLDGFSSERIKQARNYYAKLNRMRPKTDADIERIFGRYSKSAKPVKKVLKIVKKKPNV